MNKSSYNYNAEEFNKPLAKLSISKSGQRKVLTLTQDPKDPKIKLTYEFMQRLMEQEPHQVVNDSKKKLDKREN